MTLDATTKFPGNADFCGGQLQNAGFQLLLIEPSVNWEGRFWWDSVNHVPMCYDGTTAKRFGIEYSVFTGADGTNAGTSGLVPAPAATDNTKFLCGDGTYKTPTGTTYAFSTGLTNTSGTITLNQATSGALGGVIIGSNINVSSGTISVANASTSAKGVIEIATDTEVATGTDTSRAITPKQLADGLATKITKVNQSSVAGQYTKVAVTADGIVYQGGDLTSTDIPDLSSTYLSTTLKGANSGLAELGADGKVPSSQLPSYVDDVIELLTVASSAPSTCAKDDMYYNTTSTKIFTATATNTWGTTGTTPEKSAIYVALDTNYSYRWSGSTMVNLASPVAAATESTAGIAEIATDSETSTGTDDTKIVTPKKLKNMNFVKHTASTAVGSATKGVYIAADGTATEMTYSVNKDVPSDAVFTDTKYTAGAADTSAKIYLVGATSQTAYPQTYSHDTAFVDTDGRLNSAAPASNANDTTVATTKWVKDQSYAKKVTVSNTALTTTNGICEWTITNSIASDEVDVAVYEVGTNSNSRIYPHIEVSSSAITVTLLSSTNIAADALKAVITG